MIKTMRIERQKHYSHDDDKCDYKNDDDDDNEEDDDNDGEEEEFTLLQLGLVAVGSQSDSDVGSNEESEQKNIARQSKEESEQKIM